MRNVDHWLAALLTILVLGFVMFANYGHVAEAEMAGLRAELANQSAPPVVVIEAQEMGRLVCPDGAEVYTTTDGVVGGFAVECR